MRKTKKTKREVRTWTRTDQNKVLQWRCFNSCSWFVLFGPFEINHRTRKEIRVFSIKKRVHAKVKKCFVYCRPKLVKSWERWRGRFFFHWFTGNLYPATFKVALLLRDFSVVIFQHSLLFEMLSSCKNIFIFFCHQHQDLKFSLFFEALE